MYILSLGSRLDILSLTNEVANNFWGKDDAGVSPLLDRMHSAKVTSDELKSFYNGKHRNVGMSCRLLTSV